MTLGPADREAKGVTITIRPRPAPCAQQPDSEFPFPVGAFVGFLIMPFC